MVKTQIMTASKNHDYPHFLAIKRIMKLPVVSSGVSKATYVYVKVKSSNKILEYSLENAEKTVLNVVDLSSSFVIRFEDPINRIDDLMCKSLDLVEQNIPMVTYTPEEIYFTTKTYVKAKVEPVLKRADSVKQLTMLDDALSVADKYVDKYLPDKDPGEDVVDKSNSETSSQAVKTIRHVNHFSRKLQRRLTRRTIAEAKLLKKQGYDTIQCFVYFADLLAKDPKAFAEKMQAIWKHLSEDEPENQKPPENIEQLIEMLTRESARRFVHVTNFIVKNVYMGPTYASRVLSYTGQETVVLFNNFIKFAHLEKAKTAIVEFSNDQLTVFQNLSSDVKQLILKFLSSLNLMINESKNSNAEKENKNNVSVEANNKPSQQKEEKNGSTESNKKIPKQKEEKNNTAKPATNSSKADNENKF